MAEKAGTYVLDEPTSGLHLADLVATSDTLTARHLRGYVGAG
jgi:excinuclease UvrABC ATPase subunit